MTSDFTHNFAYRIISSPIIMPVSSLFETIIVLGPLYKNSATGHFLLAHTKNDGLNLV